MATQSTSQSGADLSFLDKHHNSFAAKLGDMVASESP